MTAVYKRILDKKTEKKLTWDELAHLAKIRVASWMTGLPTSQPADDEIKKIAPVLDTTYEYLKYGE